MSKSLLAAIFAALAQVYMSGDIETIFAKWLGKLGHPGGLLAVMYLLNSIPESTFGLCTGE